MSFNVSWIIQLQDRFSAISRKIGNATDRLKKKIERLSKSMSKLGKSIKGAGTKLFTSLTLPILGLGAVSLKAAADLESLETQLSTMLRSAEKGKQAVKDLVDFTAKTPFQLEGVGQSAKVLLSFGLEAETIKQRLKAIGDVAAGSGQNIKEVATIFGQVSAASKLTGERFLQLQERSIPIAAAISKTFNIPMKSITDLITEGKISFEVFEKAFSSMSKKGGIFENAMDKLSKTLLGVFSTLKDNIFNAFAELGTFLVRALNLKENINAFIKTIQKLTARFKRFTQENPKLAKKILIVAGVLAVLGPVLIGIGVIVGGLSFAMAGLGTAIAIVASPITLTIAAIAALGSIFTIAVNKSSRFRDMMSDIVEISGLFLNLIRALASLAFKPIIVLFDMASQKLKPFLDLIKTINRFISDNLLKLFDFIFGAGAEKVKSALKTATKSAKEFSVETAIQQSVNAEVKKIKTAQEISGNINVDISAPEGVVKRAQSKSEGINLNTGINMVPVGA